MLSGNEVREKEISLDFFFSRKWFLNKFKKIKKTALNFIFCNTFQENRTAHSHSE